MLFKTYILSSCFLLLSFYSNSQTKFTYIEEQRKDSLRSVSFNVFKVREKKGVLEKTRRAHFHDGYPMREEPSLKLYSPDGKLLRKENDIQVEYFSYNRIGQPQKRVIKSKNSDDSLIVMYIYDEHQNIESLKSMGNDDIVYHFNDGILRGPSNTYFTNFYLHENDTITFELYNKAFLISGNINRLFNQSNQLIEEKKTHVRHNKNMEIDLSIDSTEKYTSITYDNLGNLKLATEKTLYKYRLYPLSRNQREDFIQENITYYNITGTVDSIISSQNNEIKSSIINYYNSEGELVKKVTNQFFSRSVTTEEFEQGRIKHYTTVFRSGRVYSIDFEYELDENGNWVKCIHHVQGKPLYWIERNYEYY